MCNTMTYGDKDALVKKIVDKAMEAFYQDADDRREEPPLDFRVSLVEILEVGSIYHLFDYRRSERIKEDEGFPFLWKFINEQTFDDAEDFKRVKHQLMKKIGFPKEDSAVGMFQFTRQQIEAIEEKLAKEFSSKSQPVSLIQEHRRRVMGFWDKAANVGGTVGNVLLKVGIGTVKFAGKLAVEAVKSAPGAMMNHMDHTSREVGRKAKKVEAAYRSGDISKEQRDQFMERRDEIEAKRQEFKDKYENMKNHE